MPVPVRDFLLVGPARHGGVVGQGPEGHGLEALVGERRVLGDGAGDGGFGGLLLLARGFQGFRGG